VLVVPRRGSPYQPLFLNPRLISIPMPDPSVGWRREWFLLWNNADAPLPIFMGDCPIPHPNWGFGVARADLHRLQPPARGRMGIVAQGIDGRGNSVDFFQPRGSTASSMRSDHAYVSGPSFFCPPFLHGVGQHRDQDPGMRDLAKSWLWLGPPKGMALSCLYQPLFLNVSIPV
jgi:hypothetical protein